MQQQQQMLQLQHSLQQAQQHQQMAAMGLANQQSGPPQQPSMMQSLSGLGGPPPPQQQPFALPPPPVTYDAVYTNYNSFYECCCLYLGLPQPSSKVTGFSGPRHAIAPSANTIALPSSAVPFDPFIPMPGLA